MSRRAFLLTYLILPVLLLAVALGLRAFFFCGFVLGDDREEFALTQLIVDQGPTFEGHLQYRFSLWWFNVMSFRLLGSSETAFFLPTLLMSASLSVVAYLLLQAGAYSRSNSFLAGLFVASAPFEVLLGAVRANDLILAWFLALALLAFMGLSNRPIWQGFSLAVLLWLAFYTKLWAVYILPALAIYYLLKATRGREWHSAVSFVVSSATLHSATALFWKIKIGVFFPFLVSYSATYSVAPSELLRTFLYYPA